MPYVVGVDENGLGPRLGPLVVTAVGFRAAARTDGAATLLEKRPRGAIANRLGDSKQFATYRDGALGEAWARAFVAAVGSACTTPALLLRSLLLDAEAELRSRCPEGHGGQCWSDEGEAFGCDPALQSAVGRDLSKLAAKGLVPHAVKVAVVCTERLNDALLLGKSRFLVDLHAMERLVLSMREVADEDVTAICGKVGGYNQYGAAFGPLAGRLHVALEEGRACSTYRFSGVGTISFVRDADADVLAVGLASLIGKWVRDHFMRRVVRYHREPDPDLPNASGYHDPVTSRFIAMSAMSRRARGLPDDCFERRSLRGAGEGSDVAASSGDGS